VDVGRIGHGDDELALGLAPDGNGEEFERHVGRHEIGAVTGQESLWIDLRDEQPLRKVVRDALLVGADRDETLDDVAVRRARELERFDGDRAIDDAAAHQKVDGGVSGRYFAQNMPPAPATHMLQPASLHCWTVAVVQLMRWQ